MAGLCEGGNEPSGSLKAICKHSPAPLESDGLQSVTQAESSPHTTDTPQDAGGVHLVMAAISCIIIIALNTSSLFVSHGNSSQYKQARAAGAEYADIVYVYGLCDGNATAAVLAYQARFPNRRIPSAQVKPGIGWRIGQSGAGIVIARTAPPLPGLLREIFSGGEPVPPVGNRCRPRSVIFMTLIVMKIITEDGNRFQPAEQGSPPAKLHAVIQGAELTSDEIPGPGLADPPTNPVSPENKPHLTGTFRLSVRTSLP
ncbi:hypothetical protein ANN_25116 [Periplaneta americana]|uniref:DUF4817 domain-containing protein n=1 Tax=Periplaneta americana TaxID=6978 RepID=A0ABQ8S0E2_PERAM|nr:hypothetical protein ANN_25116 [Periplaneta americana]